MGGDGGMGGTAGMGGEGGVGGDPGTPAFYEQNFESLDETSATALEDDGWVFFANVFDDSASATPKFNYGPFAAPNATTDPSTVFISAVASGEGDVPQGAQQLSVFNDYNCCSLGTATPEGHGDPDGDDRVEINVFQEPFSQATPISADEVGKTLTFAFDAKRGNIEGATTAFAFIKTIDPNSGFSQTNFITVEMTGIPITWARYSVELVIDAGLEGQILQFGFVNTASDFEGSGIFYDNLRVDLE